MKFNSHSTALGLVAIAALLPAAAWAQAEAGVPDAQMQDIIVTATRASTSLQKTPIAVTAISSDQLQAKGVASLQDIAVFSPSLSINTNGARIAIRGISVDTTTQSPAVGVYLDDVYFPNAAGNAMGLFDVARVEVLRGPQGTLFGRNTIAGAIQYISNKPTNKFGGYVDGTVGSFNRRDIQAAVNIPLSNTLALRLSGNAQNRDGFVLDRAAGIYRGGRAQEQARAILRWTPSGKLTVDLEGNYLHTSERGRAVISGLINPNAQFATLSGSVLTQSLASNGHYDFAGFNAPDYANFTYKGGQGTIAYKISDNLSVKSITAYSWSRSAVNQDLDQTPLPILVTQASRDVTKLFTQEVQISGKFLDDKLSVTTGYYYYNSKAPNTQVKGIILGAATFPSAGDSERDITANAFYGQATFNLTHQLSITGGLRYSSENNDSYQLAAGARHLKSSFKNTSPYVGVNFQATQAAMIYAKYSKGFKAGGQTVNANLPGGSLAFDPENAETYEAGLRFEFFDRHVRFNPTFYYTNWNNIQFNLLIPTNGTIVTATKNAGDATIKGLELEGQIIASSRLTFTGAASFSSSHYNRVPALTRVVYPNGFFAGGTTLPNIGLDSPLSRSPDTRVTLGATYTLPIGDKDKLTANISGTYTSSQYANVTLSDQIFLPSNTVLQARLQYDMGEKYSLSVFATNLTNEFYLTDGIGYGKGYTVGVDRLDPARPREIGVELRAKF